VTCVFRHRWRYHQPKPLVTRWYSSRQVGTGSYMAYRTCMRCDAEQIVNVSKAKARDLLWFYDHAALPPEHAEIDHGDEQEGYPPPCCPLKDDVVQAAQDLIETPHPSVDEALARGRLHDVLWNLYTGGRFPPEAT
jgi:hypothetical protein